MILFFRLVRRQSATRQDSPCRWTLFHRGMAQLWEVRIQLASRIARVIFTVDDNTMVLLHAFIKKSQATPQEDLALAVTRLKQARS